MMAVLALLCATAWLGTYRKYPTELNTPILYAYAFDAVQQLGMVKGAADRGLSSLVGGVNPYLGFPAGARWTDFPMSEDIVYLGIGLVSRVLGPHLGMNLSFMGLAILAAWCMYLVARRLRLSRMTATLAGALFAMSPYYYWRNIHHINLAVFWYLPLVILVWLWASSRKGLEPGTRRFAVAAGVMVIAGFHSNYYLNYALQVLLLIVVLQAARGHWGSARAGLWLMLISLGVFLFANADTLITFARFGTNPEAVNRPISDTIRYGLRPMELLIPGDLHRIFPLSLLGRAYRPQGTGEFPSPFLGFVGTIGFILLVVQGLRALFFAEGRGMSSRFLGFSLWLMWVGVAGGLMQFVQTIVGFTAFRSNNRVSILILGLSLLYGGRGIDRLLRRRRPVVAAGCCAAIMLFGLWEQSPDVLKLGDMAREQKVTDARVRSDEKFVEKLEQELPEGVGVMQWPPMAFPEGGGVGGVPDYDYFRPYLYTRKFRFSFGGMKGRPEAAYPYQVWNLKPEDAIARLDADGFKAVIFHMGAVGADRVRAWSAAASVVRPTRVFGSEYGDWLVVTWQ